MVAMLVAVASTMNPLDGLCAISELVRSSPLRQRQSLNPTQLRVEIHGLTHAIPRLAKGMRAKEDLALFRQAPQTVRV